jgi:type I restriction enzyme S subunit
MTPRLRSPQFTGEWKLVKFGSFLNSVSSGKSKTLTDGQRYPIYGSTGEIGSSDSFDYSGDKILIARVGANAGSMYRVNGKYKVSDNTLIVNLNENVDTTFTQFALTRFNLNRLVFGSGQPLVTGGL